jgi:DNA repair exonuclease SbcCD ATPase subunit
MMRVVRLRLVNFHNLTDELIEVQGGGHLFLLGDNGSGKTTALDAIHYVLSGGQSLELNAAARVGGRRDDGRSIQGVVLRFDAERGVVNEGGAIAYAALELADPATDKRLCIGIGTEATTMEARVSRWGFVTRRSLDDLALVRDVEGRRFPTPREALRDALPSGDVFYRMGDYRSAVASRLFGGPALYEEVCRFWSMGKAYREIVAGSKDFAGLFRRLLPGPDPDVFGDIVRSLRAVGDLEVTLREIEEQRDYVAGLMSLQGEVAAQRELQARYDWLIRFRHRESAAAEHGAALGRAAGLAEDIERLTDEIAGAEARAEAAAAAVREAEAEDAGGLIAALRAGEERAAELGREAAAQRREMNQAESRHRAAEAAREGAEAALSERTERVRAGLEAAIDRAAQLPGQLPRARALAAAVASSPLEVAAWEEPWRAARDEARHRRDQASARLAEAAASLERARVEGERAAAALAAVRAHGEEQPQLAGFAAALAALRQANIAARPAYEIAEPRPEAAAGRLAWLESLIDDAALAALIVAPGDRGRAREIVAGAAPGVRVVVATSDRVALPAWAAELFAPAANAETAAALAWLAAAAAQPEAFGAVRVAGADGALEHRGAAFRPERAAPRLLGRAARERAHRARVAAAEDAVAAADEAVATAHRVAAAAEDAVARAAALAAASDAARDRDLAELAARAAHAAESAAFTGELLESARERLRAATERADEAGLRVAALRARAEQVNLAELQARIASLRAAADRARAALTRVQGQLAVANDHRDRELGAAASLKERMTEQGEALARAADRLRGLLPGDLRAPGDAEIERYVRVTQRGDSFKSVEHIAARLAEAERAETRASAEIEGDGSRGVKNIHFAARFGFSYDPGANRIADRRQQPAAGVLADLDGTVAEQRQVITDRTRELMETLVMGSLARDLQRQIENLEGVIKDINRLLAGLRFGRTRYQFRAAPLAERKELVDIVRRISVLDKDSRDRFRVWIDERLDELRAGDADGVPELLDYRTWYQFELRVHSEGGGDGTDFKRIRRLGSGGEQGVPNYLLVLALARLMFENAGARLRPLLFDEAFYGIDAGRRDQLLRFATELELQLFIASPDQDGVTPAVRHATTLFIVKDPHGDVHLAPYHYWHRAESPQPELFAAPAPSEPAADEAECRLDGH